MAQPKAAASGGRHESDACGQLLAPPAGCSPIHPGGGSLQGRQHVGKPCHPTWTEQRARAGQQRVEAVEQSLESEKSRQQSGASGSIMATMVITSMASLVAAV